MLARTTDWCRRSGVARPRPRVLRLRACVGAGALGPRFRTSSTAVMASRSSRIQSASCSATRRTHQASASLRLRATPPSISVSSTRRSAMRSRVMTGTPAVVKRTFEPPQTAPHETVRRKAGWASSAMRMRAPRLSSRKPLMRACSATRPRPRPPPREAAAAPGCPTTWISSPSISMVGLPANQLSGTLPANHAPISRSCSGPEGGGVVERRRPRWAPLALVGLLVVHITRLHDYATRGKVVARCPPAQRNDILKPTWEGTKPRRS